MEQLYTTMEIAERFGVSVVTVQAWVRRYANEIEDIHYPHGSGRHILMPLAAAEELRSRVGKRGRPLTTGSRKKTRKPHKERHQELMAKIKKAEIMLEKGMTQKVVAQQLGVSESTLSVWRRKYNFRHAKNL